MEKMECDKDMELPIIEEYKKILAEAEGKEVILQSECKKKVKLEGIERFEFYEQAKKCYAVIATGFVLLGIVRYRETSQYANIILQKGVITNPEFLLFCFHTELEQKRFSNSFGRHGYLLLFKLFVDLSGFRILLCVYLILWLSLATVELRKRQLLFGKQVIVNTLNFPPNLIADEVYFNQN